MCPLTQPMRCPGGQDSLGDDLNQYAKNIWRRFPHVFIALGSPNLSEHFELEEIGLTSHSIKDTGAARTIKIVLPRRSPSCLESRTSTEGTAWEQPSTAPETACATHWKEDRLPSLWPASAGRPTPCNGVELRSSWAAWHDGCSSSTLSPMSFSSMSKSSDEATALKPSFPSSAADPAEAPRPHRRQGPPFASVLAWKRGFPSLAVETRLRKGLASELAVVKVEPSPCPDSPGARIQQVAERRRELSRSSWAACLQA
mmetsp:Transcript_82517/g.224078  ORF Transcript_82517/g.224078 Transcript_82517/m.224078 type:complete len:257 (-) Transcript_82517:108-878(-)